MLVNLVIEGTGVDIVIKKSLFIFDIICIISHIWVICGRDFIVRATMAHATPSPNVTTFGADNESNFRALCECQR